jgi:putative flippase GtrA
MEHNHDHSKHKAHEHGPSDKADAKQKQSRLRLSVSATLHCLLGCGLGEVLGMVIGTALSMSMVSTIILAVILGFVFGFLLGIIPLIRAGFSLRRAFKQVAIAETLSIAVMETAEILVQVYTPGVMEAGLSSPLFWFGMLLALIAGFAAAFPINYIMIGRGVRHIH